MHIIEWESHTIKESYELVMNLSFWKGRVYKLSYDDQHGRIVTRPAVQGNAEDYIIGFGYFDTTEIVLQSMGKFITYKFQIFNRRNLKEPIGYFDYKCFWLYNVRYDIDIKMKNIFSKKDDPHIKLDISIGVSGNIFTLEIKSPFKKWYHPVSYFDYINGKILLAYEPNWEFINVVILYFDHYFDHYVYRD